MIPKNRRSSITCKIPADQRRFINRVVEKGFFKYPAAFAAEAIQEKCERLRNKFEENEQ